MNNIEIEQLSNTIENSLKEYGTVIANKIKFAGEDEAKKAVKTLKKTSPKKRGKYAKSWKMKIDVGVLQQFKYVVYNEEYRLTHLLERGHAKANGGRTQAYPHIAITEKDVISNFEKEVVKIIEGN